MERILRRLKNVFLSMSIFNPHHKFVVFCHEHQLELVRKILPKNKTIYSFSLKVIESIAGLRPSPEASYEENEKQNE